MRDIIIQASSFLILLCLLISVEASQTSGSIRSVGMIKYSEDKLVLKRFTGRHYFRDMSAETIAELFDMCIAWPKDEEKIRQIKHIRADFKALLYRNIRAIYNTTPDEWQLAEENNWLLKDENGEYVYVSTWPENYAVDIGNPQYQIWVANWIKERVDQYGYDGVWADCSFNAFASEQFFDLSAMPINPRTGVYWTDLEVKQALIEMRIELRRAMGSKLIGCNGIFHGTTFERGFDEYLEILPDCPIDGLMSEGLWYQYNGIWMSEKQWLRSLNMLVWFQDNFLKGKPGRFFVPTCKLESFGGKRYRLPSNCTREQMATYAFASTLLGVNTDQNYLCMLSPVNFTSQVIQLLHNIDIGKPTNEYYMINGSNVYARDFSKAKVLVNPTSSSYTVEFKDTFRTLEGEIVTEITVEAHTGMILIKSGPP